MEKVTNGEDTVYIYKPYPPYEICYKNQLFRFKDKKEMKRVFKALQLVLEHLCTNTKPK